MRHTFILFVCLTLGCSDQSAKPVRLENETNKARKKFKGDFLKKAYLF